MARSDDLLRARMLIRAACGEDCEIAVKMSGAAIGRLNRATAGALKPHGEVPGAFRAFGLVFVDASHE